MKLNIHVELKLMQVVAFWRKLLSVTLILCGLASCYGSDSDGPPMVYCTLPMENDTDWAIQFSGFGLDCTKIHSLDDAKNTGSVVEIDIQQSAQSDIMDFAGFDDLKRLYVKNETVTELSLSTNHQLTNLTLETPSLAALDLPPNHFSHTVFKNLDSLEILEVDGFTTDYLDIVGDLNFDPHYLFSINRLRALSTNYFNIASYNATQLPEIVDLTLSGVTGQMLDLSLAPALQKLTIMDSDLDTLQVIAPAETKILSVINSSFNTLDLFQSAGLLELEVLEANVNSIDMSSLVNLQRLQINNQSTIADLDLTNNLLLTDILIEGTDLQTLDLSLTSAINIGLLATQISSVNLPPINNPNHVGIINISGHKSESLVFEGGSSYRNFTFENNQEVTKVLDISSLKSLGLLVINQVDLDEMDITNLNSLRNIYINQSTVNEIRLPEFFNQETHVLDNGDFVCKPGNSWPTGTLNDLEAYADDIYCQVQP